MLILIRENCNSWNHLFIIINTKEHFQVACVQIISVISLLRACDSLNVSTGSVVGFFTGVCRTREKSVLPAVSMQLGTLLISIISSIPGFHRCIPLQTSRVSVTCILGLEQLTLLLERYLGI